MTMGSSRSCGGGRIFAEILIISGDRNETKDELRLTKYDGASALEAIYRSREEVFQSI